MEAGAITASRFAHGPDLMPGTITWFVGRFNVPVWLGGSQSKLTNFWGMERGMSRTNGGSI